MRVKIKGGRKELSLRSQKFNKKGLKQRNRREGAVKEELQNEMKFILLSMDAIFHSSSKTDEFYRFTDRNIWIDCSAHDAIQYNSITLRHYTILKLHSYSCGCFIFF